MRANEPQFYLRQVAILVLLTSTLLSDGNGAESTELSSKMAAQERQIIENENSLTGIIQKSYAAASQINRRSSVKGLFKRFIVPSEDILMEATLVPAKEIKRFGYNGSVRLSAFVRARATTAQNVNVVAEITHNAPIENLLALYPRNTVVDRVLRCKKLAEDRRANRPVESLRIGFGQFWWPSSEIRGTGFAVTVFFGGKQRNRSDLDYPAFGAFSALYPVAGEDMLKRVKGPTASDDLAVIPFALDLEDAPELFEF